MVFDGKIKHLALFDYGWFDEFCDKIKYLISEKVVLQIVLIIILVGSELIRIILHQLKKLFITLQYSSNQLLIKLKINTTIIYFLKRVHINIDPISNIFKWMFILFIYYTCYIMIE